MAERILNFKPPLLSLLTFLVLSLLFLSHTAAVKKEDFKTCAQSAFCRRHRAYADFVRTNGSTLHYELLRDSLMTKGPTLKGIVKSGDVNLALELVPFDGGVRVLLEEKDGLKSRFKVTPSIASPPEPSPFKIASFPSDVSEPIVVSYGKENSNRIALYSSPFGIQFLQGSEPIASLNSRKRLMYEHYRSKPAPEPAPEPSTLASPEVVSDAEPANSAAADAAETQVEKAAEPEPPKDRLKELLNDAIWEETFRSWTDSKPHGPASMGFDVTFHGSSNVYGIPEHASPLSLKTTSGENSQYTEPYRLYNLDVFEYELDNPYALYGSVPFMSSHSKEKGSAGIFWNNAAEMWIDVRKEVVQPTQGGMHQIVLGNSMPAMGTTSDMSRHTDTVTHWIAESGSFDVFFFLPKTSKPASPKEILSSYLHVSGLPSMPQQFALGYHQCRWNYLDTTDVENVDDTFEKEEIPYDVIWLDIEHTDGKRYFTWDEASGKWKIDKVTDIQQGRLKPKGRKMVTIIDPHIKKDENFPLFRDARDKKLFVCDKHGKQYEGWCWPGDSAWLDYLNAVTRDYWAHKFKFEDYKGSTDVLFTWNDMNEPSVFNGPEITMPKDNIHRDDNGVEWEHRDLHNVYGMLQHMSTFKGHSLRTNDVQRPFVLSRAFFAGTQRFGAVWTGDNMAKWDHLTYSMPMLLGATVAGISFVGADVGGFFGNPEPDLFARWYQAGAFQPFFRGHAHIDTKRREPWIFGDPYTSYVREAIKERYRLSPFWYTLFASSSLKDGVGAMRPMFWEFPKDETTYAMDDQYMVGDALLVKPVTAKDQESVSVYLPEGVWYNYFDFSVHHGPGQYVNVPTPMTTIPVFLRGGSIIPLRTRVRRSLSLMKEDPVTLLVALDGSGSATGEIYLDDGSTYNYLKGERAWWTFSAQLKVEQHKTPKSASMVISGQSKEEGKSVWDSNVVVERVVVVFPPTLGKVTVEGVFKANGDEVLYEVANGNEDWFGRGVSKVEEGKKQAQMVMVKKPGWKIVGGQKAKGEIKLRLLLE